MLRTVSCLPILLHDLGAKQSQDLTQKQRSSSLSSSVTSGNSNHHKNPVYQMTPVWSSSVNQHPSDLNTSAPIDRYRAGFNACAHEIQYFLTRSPGVDAEARMRILEHLANHVQNLFWIKFNGDQNSENSGLMRALKLKQVLTERHEQDILRRKRKAPWKNELFDTQGKVRKNNAKILITPSNPKSDNQVTSHASGTKPLKSQLKVSNEGPLAENVKLHERDSDVSHDENQKQMIEYQEGSENVWRPW